MPVFILFSTHNFSADIEEESSIEVGLIPSGSSSDPHDASCTSSDHFILDRVNEKEGDANCPVSPAAAANVAAQRKVSLAEQQHYRLKRLRESSEDFIRLTKPLTVRCN